MQVSSAAIPLSMLLSYVTATTEAFVVRFIGFQTTKIRLEGGNCYADNLLLLDCLRIAVLFTLNKLTDKTTVCSSMVSLSIAQNETVYENILRALYLLLHAIMLSYCY